MTCAPAAVNPDHELESSIAERLQSGRDFCFAAFHGDRLVNYSWFALDAIEPEHGFGAGLKLPRIRLSVQGLYGARLSRAANSGAALSRAVEHFCQCGAAKMIAIVDFANRASLEASSEGSAFAPPGGSSASAAGRLAGDAGSCCGRRR